MSIYALMNDLVTVQRTTRYLLDPVAVAASLDPDRQPAATGILAVVLSGMTDAVGTVTLSGTVSGSSDSEVVTTDRNGRFTTIKRFSALDASGGVATSGLSGGTVTVEAEAEGTYALASAYPATRQDTARGTWPDRIPGTHAEDRATWLVAYSDVFTPRIGDRIVEDASGRTWEIKQIAPHPDRWRPTHWEAQCVIRSS